MHVKVRAPARPKRGQPTGRQCDDRKCRRPWTVECWLYDSARATDVLDGRYCGDHAVHNGFCRFCGNFSAGMESFDFNNPRGICDNCRSSEPEDVDEWDELEPDGIPDLEDEVDRMADLFITKR